MTTIDDQATEREEQFRDIALRNQRQRAVRSRITPRGECVICGETDLPQSDALFCCRECRDDWDRKERALGQAGRLR